VRRDINKSLTLNIIPLVILPTHGITHALNPGGTRYDGLAVGAQAIEPCK
jgi:hypothetical protein